MLATPILAQLPGRIVGTVVDPDGKPLADVSVRVEGIDIDQVIETETRRNGRFVATVADTTRRYRVELEKEGYRKHEEVVDPPGMEPLRATFQLAPADATTPAATASVVAPPEMRGSGPAVRAFNAGAEAFNADDLEAAAAHFEEALGHDPELRQAREVLPTIYLSLGEQEKALEAADTLLALVPDDVAGLAVRADALSELGRQEEANATLERLAELDRTPNTAIRFFNSGAAAANRGETEAAIRLFSRALEIDPELASAHRALAKLELGRGNHEAALEHAGALLALAPGDADALVVQHDAYVNLGNPAAAEATLEELERASPKRAAAAFLELGSQQFAAGDAATAVTTLERALALSPDDGRIHYQLGLALISAGRGERAKEHLQRFLELSPGSPDADTARQMLAALEG